MNRMKDLLAVTQEHVLFGTLMTIAAYAIAYTTWRRLGTPSLLHPVLVATALVAVVLISAGTGYDEYLAQATMLNEALGVVVILLAVPLYRQFHLILEASGPIGVALVAGSMIAVVTSLALPVFAGAPVELLATLAPRSATAAVAVEISLRLGGAAGLTAVVVIATGNFGGIFGPAILEAVGIRDDRAGAGSHNAPVVTRFVRPA